MPLTTAFFSFLFYKSDINKKTRPVILFLFCAYVAALIIVHFYLPIKNPFNIYFLLAGGFVVTCCAIFFLYNYFTLDSIADQRKWQPLVWISTGIVIFYPLYSITLALRKQIYLNNIRIFGLLLYQAMPQILSLFMYSCFAYAFYLCRQTNQNS